VFQCGRGLCSRQHSQRAKRPGEQRAWYLGQYRFPVADDGALAGAFRAPVVRVQVLDEGGAGGAQRQRPGIGVAVDVAGVGEDVAERLIIQAAQCQ
jgi:hypothetical protein